MCDTRFNLSTVFDTVAHAVPDQEVMVWRDRRLRYRDMNVRIDGVAHFLVARGLGCHAEFAPHVAAIRDQLPDLEVLLQVADHSGHPLLPGAADYESACVHGRATSDAGAGR